MLIRLKLGGSKRSDIDRLEAAQDDLLRARTSRCRALIDSEFVASLISEVLTQRRNELISVEEFLPDKCCSSHVSDIEDIESINDAEFCDEEEEEESPAIIERNVPKRRKKLYARGDSYWLISTKRRVVVGTLLLGTIALVALCFVL